MPSGVTRDNWSVMTARAIERVQRAAADAPASSFEEGVLIGEANRLQQMRDQVRDRAPSEREPVCSYLIAVSVREPVNIPKDIIEQVGAVFDVYRRWRERLVWAS
jgi:hypothetical protein